MRDWELSSTCYASLWEEAEIQISTKNNPVERSYIIFRSYLLKEHILRIPVFFFVICLCVYFQSFLLFLCAKTHRSSRRTTTLPYCSTTGYTEWEQTDGCFLMLKWHLPHVLSLYQCKTHTLDYTINMRISKRVPVYRSRSSMRVLMLMRHY